MQLFDACLAPAVAEARLLHPQDGGFFTVGSRAPGSDKAKGWHEEHFPMSRLDAVANSLRGRPDSYISQASFATKLRKSFNAKSLRSTFVDLDTYNLTGNDSPETLVGRVIARAKELGVPEPSYIVNSGRGLYGKWVYDAPINAGLLPQWKILQKKMVSGYLALGADTKVVDPARVLRLQETINSKNDAPVTLLHQGKTHSFADLFRSTEGMEVLRKTKEGKIVRAADTVVAKGVRRSSADLATDGALTDLDGLQLYSAKNEPTLQDLKFNASTLNWCRFLDLRDLVISRGGVHKGSRDITLFWMVNFLAQTHVIQPMNFWQEVGELIKSFPTGTDFDPLNDGSLGTLFDRVQAHGRGEKVQFDGQEYSPIYTPRNDTLLNILQITSEEESGLRTIISRAEKLRRADEQVPGRQLRRQERTEAREIAVTLSEQGVTASEIANKLGKHRSTISRWLDTGPELDRPYIETRGRRPQQARPICRLTGRGPIYSAGAPGSPGLPIGHASDPAKEFPPGSEPKKRAWSEQELRRRTKTRQPKCQHRPERRIWGAEEISQWLALRQAARSAEQALRQIAQDGLQMREHEAASTALTTELIERIRRSAALARPQICIPGASSASSTPKTGPPAAQSGL